MLPSTWRTCILALLVSCPAHAACRATAELPDLVERVISGVVNIRTVDASPKAGPSRGTPMDQFLRSFLFPFAALANSAPRSLGSGFFYRNRSFVITNYHVISSASKILIMTSASEKPIPAQLIGKDEQADLALLRIDQTTRGTVLELDSSTSMRLGDPVFAIGNPFGYGHTVTRGILSAKGRSIGAGPFDEFLQTDAAINPGNSGGPLFDMCGKVVGINTAKDMDAQGISFALPSETAMPILGSLLATGTAERPFLGLYISEIKSPLSGGKETFGVRVDHVAERSPAHTAGVRAGDVVLAVGRKEIQSVQDFSLTVAKIRPGQALDVRLFRSAQGPVTVRLFPGKLGPTSLAAREKNGLPSASSLF